MFALLIPTLLSFLVLAVHFLKDGPAILIFVSLCAPLLLVFRRPWATHLLQILLVIGALEWIRTAMEIAAFRQQNDLAWHRMAIILGSVAAFTALSATVYFLPPLRRRYAPKPPP